MQRSAICNPTAASRYPRIAYRYAHTQTQRGPDLDHTAHRTPPGCHHFSVPRAESRWPYGPARSAVGDARGVWLVPAGIVCELAFCHPKRAQRARNRPAHTPDHPSVPLQPAKQ